MVTMVIATTPNNPTAAIMAIIAIDVFAVFCKPLSSVVDNYYKTLL
jgi:aspartate/methionine/tyrosine aminotransferase